MKKILIVAVMILLFPCYGFGGEIIIAVPDLNDSDCSDGKCWLQYALHWAQGFIDEDNLIKVARGTYKSGDIPWESYRYFDLSNESECGVRIEGGYDENGQNRILDPNNTIIQGTISDIFSEARGCLTIDRANGGSVFIEGLTFKDSNRSGLTVNTYVSGFGQNGNITIQNNIFKNIQNVPGLTAETENETNSPYKAGDINVKDNTVESCGGINIATHNFGDDYPGNIVFESNSIIKNICVDSINNISAGGIFESGSIMVKNNRIMNNQSAYAAGGLTVSGCQIYIENNRVLNNETGGSGGGLSISSNGHDPQVRIVNNIVSGNVSGGNGGGIDLSAVSSDLPFGFCDIINNTITGNKSLSTETPHHGLSFEYPSIEELYILSNIIWGNTDPVHTGYDIYLGNIVECTLIYSNDFSTLYEIGPSQKIDNINVDPSFVSPTEDNFHLKSDSVCIDNGDQLLTHPYIDFEGDMRPYDGDNDGVAIVDIGADEYIDWVFVFTVNFGVTNCSPQGDCEGDFDQDNDIDGSDLAILVAKLASAN